MDFNENSDHRPVVFEIDLNWDDMVSEAEGIIEKICGVDGSNRNGDQERNRKLPPQMVPDPNYRRHLNSRLRT